MPNQLQKNDSAPDVERAYAMICEALDSIHVNQERIFLAKLVLLLALKLNDDDALAEAIAASVRDL